MEKLRSELFALVQPSSLNSGGIKKIKQLNTKIHILHMPLGLFLLVLFQESSLGFSSLHFFFFFPEAVSLEDIFSRTVGSGIQLLPELLSISAAIGAY